MASLLSMDLALVCYCVAPMFFKASEQICVLFRGLQNNIVVTSGELSSVSRPTYLMQAIAHGLSHVLEEVEQVEVDRSKCPWSAECRIP